MTKAALKDNSATDNKFTPAVLDLLLREGARGFFETAPKSILALVLTGSISRGEGSFIAGPDGGAKLIGDVEFLLVASDINEGRRKAMELERFFTELLSRRNIDAPVDVTAAPPSYFEGLAPHIFGVELKAHGKVIAGDVSMMDRIPEFGPAEIPAWDALHLLFNRMVEQMIALEGLVDGDIGALKRAHYQNIKLTLDIGGSMLASLGLYRTTYAERAGAIEEALARIENEAVRERLSGLAGEVESATEVKLNPESDPILTMEPGALISGAVRESVSERWLELARTAKVLWMWEINRYLGSGWSDDVDSLLSRYCRKEKVTARLYGWSKCIGRLRRKGAVDYSRLFRLMGSGSPRGHIYACAARLFFALPAAIRDRGGVLSAKEHKRICSELPALVNESGVGDINWTGVCGEVVYNWNMHVKTNE